MNLIELLVMLRNKLARISLKFDRGGVEGSPVVVHPVHRLLFDPAQDHEDITDRLMFERLRRKPKRKSVGRTAT